MNTSYGGGSTSHAGVSMSMSPGGGGGAGGSASYAEGSKRVYDGDIIRVNVGGVAYSTFTGTLRAHPTSSLAQIFENPIAAPRDARDGSYFVDRNGSVFGLILDYLRTGTLVVPRDPVTYNSLRQEVCFYGLPVAAQMPAVQPSMWGTVPASFRHARVVQEEMSKHVEWEEGALPANMSQRSMAEIIGFLGEKGYKVVSEYTSRGSHGYTSIWLRKKEAFPGANVPVVIADPH